MMQTTHKTLLLKMFSGKEVSISTALFSTKRCNQIANIIGICRGRDVEEFKICEPMIDESVESYSKRLAEKTKDLKSDPFVRKSNEEDFDNYLARQYRPAMTTEFAYNVLNMILKMLFGVDENGNAKESIDYEDFEETNWGEIRNFLNNVMVEAGLYTVKEFFSK
jgi:hypothetical protein